MGLEERRNYPRGGGRENLGLAIFRGSQDQVNPRSPAPSVFPHLWAGVSALSPLQGCPRVEKPGEPKVRVWAFGSKRTFGWVLCVCVAIVAWTGRQERKVRGASSWVLEGGT